MSSRWEEYRWATNGHPQGVSSCILVARRTAFFPVTLGIVPASSSLRFPFLFPLYLSFPTFSVSVSALRPTSPHGPARPVRANRRTAYNKPDRAEFLPRRLPFFSPVCPFCLPSAAEKRQPLIYGRNDDRLLSSFAYDCGLGRPWKDQGLPKKRLPPFHYLPSR